MNPQPDWPCAPPPRNGAGRAALILGLVALVFTFVPIIGDFIAIPAAICAIVAGLIGFDRADRGLATNRRDALIGASLGALTLLITLFILAAVHGSATP